MRVTIATMGVSSPAFVSPSSAISARLFSSFFSGQAAE